MDRVLVTGACGFSGSHMLKILLDEGYQVRGTDLEGAFSSEKVKMIHREIGLDRNAEGLELVPSDLLDRDSLEAAVKGVSTVFHTASLYDHSAPWKRW